MIANPPGNRRTISVREAVEEALKTQPRRYGLSIEYALRRYRHLKRHQPAAVSPLWDELTEKVDRRMAEHPDEDDFTAMETVLSNERPSRYFITPVYAEKIFYRRRLEARRRHRIPRSLK